MPTSRQIQEDLQTASPGDVVFLNPPCDNENKGIESLCTSTGLLVDP